MKKKFSIQLRLTLLTALIVIASCLILSIFISTSASFYMDSIGDSIVSIFLEKPIQGNITIENNVKPKNVSISIKNTQREFWKNSLFITFIIALISSSFIYLIVGFSLKPLNQLGDQVEEIEAKNINQRVFVDSDAKEIVVLVTSFNNMLKRLEEAFNAHKQFSSNAAHELRTPLAIVKTQLEVLHKDKNPTIEDYAYVIEKIESQVDRFSNVINVLLEMTQTQTALKNDYISLSEIVEEITCDLSELALKNNVEIITLPGDATIMGNDILIYRAIYNLVENAIKYNKKNGKVVIEIKQCKSLAKIIVSDTGMGISKDDYNNIFNPFFRTNKSLNSNIYGAGLGLSLVQEIAKKHNGNVKIIKSSPSGTDIELTLEGVKI